MRLQLQLTPNTEPVPFDHLHQLTGTLHKWLGPNKIHDGVSLYSFGWLQGGESRTGGLRFQRGASWNLSFFDEAQARRLLKGLLEQPEVAYGMGVAEVREVASPAFWQQYHFSTDGSAILARRSREDGSREYLLWDNPAADDVLTTSFRRKLTAAGFTGEDLNVRVTFDRTYARARTRKVSIKGIAHRGSECPVLVEGTPDALHFAWTVGLGDLTGSGFGSLR